MTPVMATRMVASEMTPEFFATCGTVKRFGDENDSRNTENGDKSCPRTYMRYTNIFLFLSRCEIQILNSRYFCTWFWFKEGHC